LRFHFFAFLFGLGAMLLLIVRALALLVNLWDNSGSSSPPTLDRFTAFIANRAGIE
jgi:hypothetical protein